MAYKNYTLVFKQIIPIFVNYKLPIQCIHITLTHQFLDIPILKVVTEMLLLMLNYHLK
jgi:hypothetical protein